MPLPTRTLKRGRLRAIVLLLVAAVIGACSGVRPAATPPTTAAAATRGSGGINQPGHRDKPHVVLVSFDGFRADYLETFDLPSFRRVKQRGAAARTMRPVFPSLTFPNHYSLVTGLRPERHGIVGNSFYDPVRGQSYALSDRDAVGDGTWYRGEPIWVTAERQGMVAACFFWPGSEAAIGGIRPTYWKPYDGEIPNDDRVKAVLEWLRLPDERRPHLITLYFSELDSASHRSPLGSPAVGQALQSLDRTLGVLLDGIDALAIRDQVYLVLTSDHGMVETATSQAIALDSLIDTTDVRMGFGGPVASLHVAGGSTGATLVRNQINSRLQRGRAYLRREVPARFHYRADPRIGDVVVVMDEGWTLHASPPEARPDRPRWGMHGWDPVLPSMAALFLIAGPGVRAGVTIPAIDNVDVYPLLTELLGLRAPADLDGQPGRIHRQVMR
ncbi:MAG TPA: ectonucleotide pyrophosphatase/phosphodiesterase [Vicinamibacterales bacterium]|nr:ectonucleotide pyrophosphatase/phosphodiesterase [Vicinamibacterales bacterium]